MDIYYTKILLASMSLERKIFWGKKRNFWDEFTNMSDFTNELEYVY